MKGQYAPRYGLSSEEVMIMKAKFQKVRKGGATDWETVEQFCKWAVQEGYKPGMRIKKQYPFLPHSMENSYFVNTGDPDGERHATYIDAESPFCEKCCNHDCATLAFGCKKWREYFVKNWNENIYRSQPAARPVNVVFRYEHPDLVREGIVFEGSCSV
jgi:hypothetical protein